jgi:UDP-2,4-diacetamido-2,4,6-trideoxy-beta-L-altropyranose hydrolase
MTTRPLVLFRTDGDASVGLGHVRRCLSLADALCALGLDSTFLLKGDGAVAQRITAAGFRAQLLPGDDLQATLQSITEHRPCAVVLDSYAIDAAYIARVRSTGPLVVAIDDLGTPDPPADIVVNAAVGAERLGYRSRTGTMHLLGPSYALLQREFAGSACRPIRDQVQRVLITVGGSDPHDLSARLARWTSDLLDTVETDVVVGPLCAGANRALAGNVTLHRDPPDMRALMLRADLALCAGGQTALELAATGTPALAVRMAMNQTANLEGLAAAGTLRWCGDIGDADLETGVKAQFAALASNTPARAAMSARGRRLVDGRGAERVADAIRARLRAEQP